MMLTKGHAKSKILNNNNTNLYWYKTKHMDNKKR